MRQVASCRIPLPLHSAAARAFCGTPPASFRPLTLGICALLSEAYIASVVARPCVLCYTAGMTVLKRIVLALFFLSAPFFSFAEKTPIKNVHRYKLENGLDVYVVENHAAPLAYIEIAVKAGGIAQTSENAGLFHLYEHMMFKGNAKYPNAASVQRAISDMGVPDWNGTTGSECVNYYFTVPSALLREGMEFWSYAIRSPLLDEAEFEREKKVVLSEIEGGLSDPNTIYRYDIQKTLFPKYPWRCDPAGSPAVVRNATVDQIRAIQKTYYIPNNAALFIAGDVNPESVHALAKELYGSWERGKDPWILPIERQPVDPLSHTTFRVMPYDRISIDTAQVSVIWRGPDAGYDRKATYAADMLGYFFDDPDGVYVRTMMQNEALGIPDPEYLWEGYMTTRATSTLSFGALLLSPEKDLPQRAALFYTTLTENIVRRIRGDASIFSKRQFSRVYQKIKDRFIDDTETAERVKTSLRFWWIAADADYYYRYLDNMMKIDKNDIDRFLTEYVSERNALVTVLVNPAVYEKQKEAFAAAGFSEITADTAFWYKDAEAIR